MSDLFGNHIVGFPKGGSSFKIDKPSCKSGVLSISDSSDNLQNSKTYFLQHILGLFHSSVSI